MPHLRAFGSVPFRHGTSCTYSIVPDPHTEDCVHVRRKSVLKDPIFLRHLSFLRRNVHNKQKEFEEKEATNANHHGIASYVHVQVPLLALFVC